jgi:hypothetical protein
MNNSHSILITLLLATALSFTALASKPPAKSKNIHSKCPIITVSCPVTERPHTFTAVLVDAESKGTIPGQNLEYHWTVSGGKIATGQGTFSITMDASSTDMRGITATVDVKGLAPECETKASCTTSSH